MAKLPSDKQMSVQKYLFSLVTLAFATVSQAQVELITNGNFETVGTPGYAAQLAIDDVFDFDNLIADSTAPGASLEHGVQTVIGWQTEGYNFLMTPGSATTGGAGTVWGDYLTFWNVNNGGLHAIPDTSPTGGNFIALDAAYTFGQTWIPGQQEKNLTLPIWQNVTGLQIGQEYELTFYWAAAQQYGFNGDTWENLTVSFGEQTYTTETIQLPEYGFRDWSLETVRFTATSASQTLSFLAGGGPVGQPPFVFLDGISLQSVPEPSSLILVALGASGFLLRRKRQTEA